MKINTPTLEIAEKIQIVRGAKVLLDSDLAELYGVPTKVLIESIKRNRERFPSDFMLQLSDEEWNRLRSQNVTSNTGRGGRRYAPYALTEQGVAMLSSVLNSPQAIAANIEIMRTFARLREGSSANKELLLRLDLLESRTQLFEHETRSQILQIFDAIHHLIAAPTPNKRPIGFVTPEEK